MSFQTPSWYDSSNSFDILTFEKSINSTMNVFQNSMSFSQYSGSGDSSGGGSSGGGSGGGGGGSW